MRHGMHLAMLLFIATGCNRQDVDGVGRIGRKVVDRTQAAASPLREGFDHTLKGIGSAGLRARVQQRLQNDKALVDAKVEVVVAESAVELKGTLKRDDQRRRAVELAETTIGVERVTDHLQVE